MRDGLKDLSTITTIPYHTLQKLFEKFSWVICDSVQESCMNKQDYASIDIGIGSIDIAVDNDSVQFLLCDFFCSLLNSSNCVCRTKKGS